MKKPLLHQCESIKPHDLTPSVLSAQVSEARELPDPPLLRLESEAGNAYLSMLATLYAAGDASLKQEVHVEPRLMKLCTSILNSFEVMVTYTVGHTILLSCLPLDAWPFDGGSIGQSLRDCF